ncbi:hypothetical protein FB451DRAFT_1413380 [Mycena latifolia]|nr:hypothetical protein FB451DRAFT_1413380 [Mycena latifolia]
MPSIVAVRTLPAPLLPHPLASVMILLLPCIRAILYTLDVLLPRDRVHATSLLQGQLHSDGGHVPYCVATPSFPSYVFSTVSGYVPSSRIPHPRACLVTASQPVFLHPPLTIARALPATPPPPSKCSPASFLRRTPPPRLGILPSFSVLAPCPLPAPSLYMFPAHLPRVSSPFASRWS